MAASKSLAFRAVLAVVLMVGFYVLAIGIAMALLWLVYMQMMADRVYLRIVAFCLLGAAVILWSIFPRPDRFPPPGPSLLPSRHPRLFEALRQVAGKTGQEMPAEVYLVGDVNAWVAQRGGIMGIGSRRVMGLGLPLLQILTVSQFKAVLAHEFGHFHGGDTKLGPWVYKTRSAIGRTLENLAQHSSFLRKPFELYGNLFLRVTMAISRGQELSADHLAARTFGSKPLEDGLQNVSRGAMAFEPFWTNEAAPVLGSGFHPPLADGFARFLQAAPVAKALEEGLQRQLAGEGAHNPYDSHPPLHQRLAALRASSAQGSADDETAAAVSLLEDLPTLERELVTFGMDADEQSLQAIPWSEVGEKVYVPAWRRSVEDKREAIGSATVRAIPAKLADPEEFGQGLARETEQDEINAAAAALGAAMALALMQAGWNLKTGFGQVIRLESGGRGVHPFELVASVADTQLDPAAFLEQVEVLGIADLKL
jgi:Zn-dependent protease with chaperone function